MGFYVDLEMPEDCPMCPFAYYDMFNTFRGCDITRGKRWAVKNDKDYAELSTRPDWCPLIEVPEPHGRLIDADALTEIIDGIWDCNDLYFQPNDKICDPGDCIGCKWRETMDCFRRMVKHTPTIIQAEEET